MRGAARSGAAQFVRLIDELRGMLDEPVDRVYTRLIELSGYVQHLDAAGEEDLRERRGNVEELGVAAAHFAAVHSNEPGGGGLLAWLSECALLTDADRTTEGDRVLLLTVHNAKGLEFDAVVVSTCEHTHAFATLAALKLGKHVYCEKPLTHNVYEARVIREAAAKTKLATQMGTQIHATALKWQRTTRCSANTGERFLDHHVTEVFLARRHLGLRLIDPFVLAFRLLDLTERIADVCVRALARDEHRAQLTQTCHLR